MVVNKFMCDNIMIKNKTLPLYEQNGIYNLKKRKYKNIDTLHEYNMMTQVLTKNVRCGSLWDTIKNIVKKGKNIAKKTFNYIDKSPLLNTIKDIGFDYIQQKTGINPNDYYDITKSVVNNDSSTNSQYLTDVTTKTLSDTYNRYKNNVEQRKKNPPKPGQKGPSKREQLKNFMNDFSNNLIKQMPEQKETIKRNVDLFASGIDSIASGSINLDVWKKKAPLFLLSNMIPKGNGKCGNDISGSIKDILKNRFKIMDLRLPPTMKKLLEQRVLAKSSGDELSTGTTSTGTTSTGRLYMGRGDETKSTGGKKANDKYAKLLAALK